MKPGEIARARISVSRKSDSSLYSSRRSSKPGVSAYNEKSRWPRCGQGKSARYNGWWNPAQARACANPRLITSLTLFITARRASFAPRSFSHSHRDTIAHSRGMKSTLLGSFLSLFLPFSVCLSISIQCRQSAVAIDRVTRRNFARKTPKPPRADEALVILSIGELTDDRSDRSLYTTCLPDWQLYIDDQSFVY